MNELLPGGLFLAFSISLVALVAKRSGERGRSEAAKQRSAGYEEEVQSGDRFKELNEQLQTLKKELQHSKRELSRLELVLDSARLGVWDWNPQTNATYFNKRWFSMLGYKENEFKQELATWEMLVHPDDQASAFKDVQAHLDGHTDFYETKHRLKCKDGSWRWILDTGRVVEWDFQGKPTRATGIHQDIQAFVDIQESLTLEKEKSELALISKSQYLAAIAHDIRTPITGILTAAELLEADSSLETEQAEMAALIASSTHFLLNILNDLLDVSKMEAGKMEFECVDLNFRELLRKAKDLMETMKKYGSAKEKVKLSLIYPDKCPSVIKGDPTRLYQCIMNILSNALKFTSKGEIKIIVNITGAALLQHEESTGLKKQEQVVKGTLNVEVQDTGMGMTKEQLEHIFDPYKQAEVSTSRRFGGTGLGTTIYKKLIELMGGTLKIHSVVDEGTTVSFNVPILIPKKKKRRKARTFSLTKGLKKGLFSKCFDMTIIMAEDNMINARVCERVLNSLGVMVILVNNGKDLVSVALEDKKHSLILTDINMPRLKGHEATKELRQAGYEKAIIALTAETPDEKTKEGYLACGMTACLQKPIDWTELKMCLAKYGGNFVGNAFELLDSDSEKSSPASTPTSRFRNMSSGRRRSSTSSALSDSDKISIPTSGTED